MSTGLPVCTSTPGLRTIAITTKFSIPVSLIFEEETADPDHPLKEVDVEADDPPEPMIDGEFDVGDKLVQLLPVEIPPS